MRRWPRCGPAGGRPRLAPPARAGRRGLGDETQAGGISERPPRARWPDPGRRLPPGPAQPLPRWPERGPHVDRLPPAGPGHPGHLGVAAARPAPPCRRLAAAEFWRQAGAAAGASGATAGGARGGPGAGPRRGRLRGRRPPSGGGTKPGLGSPGPGAGGCLRQGAGLLPHQRGGGGGAAGLRLEPQPQAAPAGLDLASWRHRRRPGGGDGGEEQALDAWRPPPSSS